MAPFRGHIGRRRGTSATERLFGYAAIIVEQMFGVKRLGRSWGGFVTGSLSRVRGIDDAAAAGNVERGCAPRRAGAPGCRRAAAEGAIHRRLKPSLRALAQPPKRSKRT
jgi:hypothetical protein